MHAPEEQVPHDAADEVQLVAGRAEALAELGGQRVDLEGGVVGRGGLAHDRSRIPRAGGATSLGSRG